MTPSSAQVIFLSSGVTGEAMTFCATVNSIIHTGATPVLVDCDRETQLIDPQRIEDAITAKTRAIVPVHLCGRPCDMTAIADIARRHDLIVIEEEVVEMPTTASPLFLFGLAGGAFLALGGLLSGLRRRLS